MTDSLDEDQKNPGHKNAVAENYAHHTLEICRKRISQRVASALEEEEGVDIDFDSLLQAQRGLEKENQEIFGEKEEQYYLDRLESIPEGTVKAHFLEVLDKIKNETGAFHEWEEKNLFEIMRGWIGTGNLPPNVHHITDRKSIKDIFSLLAWLMKKGNELLDKGDVDVQGSSFGGHIFIHQGANVKEFWRTFATGRINSTTFFGDISHELTHVLQNRSDPHTLLKAIGASSAIVACGIYASSGSQMDLLIRFCTYLLAGAVSYAMMSKNALLKEMHSFRSQDTPVTDQLSISKIINEIAESYNYTNKDQLISAAVAIDRLKALGLNDKEIARLVTNARWDRKRARWSELEDKVDELASSLRFEEEDVDNLVMADRMERKIESLKARNIAAKELVRLAEQQEN